MKTLLLPFLFVIISTACVNHSKPEAAKSEDSTVAASRTDTTAKPDTLPAPFATKSVTNYSKVDGWKVGQAPVAPEGFTVTQFAGELSNPRWIYQGSNGDVFVAESNTVVTGIKKIAVQLSPKAKSQHLGSSANRITMFRDENKDGVYEKRYSFATNLNRPFGMLILNNHFYVANTDALIAFDYTPGDTLLKGSGKAILSLPGGGYNNHWTRNIIAGNNGSKIYVSVGSGSNAGEHGPENEIRRANILEINPDGSGEKIYAAGLRNPVGMGWNLQTGKLWVAVNERDELGDELVPDYITSVREGGFYGWPYSYFGQHEDPRLKDQQKPELVKKALVPDLALQPHTASLGFAFYNKQSFPSKYKNGAFVGQHGSWNKSTLAGYRVIFVPFENGKPIGTTEDFLTGFIAPNATNEVFGRPVGVTVIDDGSLLVADDAGNTVWQVKSTK